MRVLERQSDLAEGVAVLTAIEPRFAGVVASHGLPPLRRSAEGLESLLRIVTDQLISLKAGAAIWARLHAALQPFTAQTIAATPEPTLQALGLSRAKARCFRAVAAAVAGGKIDFAGLQVLPDDAAVSRLLALPGVGPWTAKIYVLSAMGRADAWPVGDLALHAAAHHLLALPTRPTEREMATLAEAWRPWRAVAARLLWSHYRGLKGMEQTGL